MSASLRESLSRLLEARIEGLQRLSGGASRETWAFDAVNSDGGRETLILRRDPPGPAARNVLGMEAEVLGAAAKVGVPVPALHRYGPADPTLLDTAFLLLQRVEGETIARKILRDEPYALARTRLAFELGAAAARIHAINPADVPAVVYEDPLEFYRDVLDVLGQPHPAFELGFRRLGGTRPPNAGHAVVHGDYRLGNVIVDQRGLAAVLDWELTHLGDPVEDLGWLCVRAWRFGGTEPVAGVGSYRALLDGYESVSGVRIDVDLLRWWQAFGTLKWGVICIRQASYHLTGAVRSVELAAIGRRVCEQELDVLALLS